MNNKGISIAINQVVLILIGIVILGLGLSFIAKVMMVAEHSLPSIDSKLEDQLRTKLGRDNVVELTRSVQTIGAKDLAIFNLGIVNDPRLVTNAATDGSQDFKVILKYSNAIGRAGQAICESGSSDDCAAKMNKAILAPELNELSSIGSNSGTYENSFNIKKNELKIITIGIVPKDNPEYVGTGQYFYSLCVCEGTACRDTNDYVTHSCSSGEFSQFRNGYGFKTFSVIVE